MLTTKLTAKDGSQYVEESFAHAVARGRWQSMRGHDVLMLGAADYVRVDGRIYSVNGDRGTAEIPFGVRWVVDVEMVARGWGATLDALAVEQFALRDAGCARAEPARGFVHSSVKRGYTR